MAYPEDQDATDLLGDGGSLLPGRLLLLRLLGVAVEKEVGHHLPGHVPGDGATQPQHLPAQVGRESDQLIQPELRKVQLNHVDGELYNRS